MVFSPELTRAYRHNLNGSSLERGATQLEVKDVSLRFGGVQALEDVSLAVRQADIFEPVSYTHLTLPTIYSV